MKKRIDATPEQIEAARYTHQTDEVEIDDDALVSDPEDGTGFWVSAWVWVDAPEEEDEAIPSSCGHSPANCIC